MKILLQKLRQIKHICEQHVDCSSCVFGNSDCKCQIKEIVYLLCRRPSDWDMEKVEGINNDSGFGR